MAGESVRVWSRNTVSYPSPGDLSTIKTKQTSPTQNPSTDCKFTSVGVGSQYHHKALHPTLKAPTLKTLNITSRVENMEENNFHRKYMEVDFLLQATGGEMIALEGKGQRRTGQDIANADARPGAEKLCMYKDLHYLRKVSSVWWEICLPLLMASPGGPS